MGPRKAVSMPLAINSLWSTWGGKLQGLILFQWTGHPGLSKGVEVMDIQGRGVGTNIVLGRWDVLVCPRVERMKKSWIQGEKWCGTILQIFTWAVAAVDGDSTGETKWKQIVWNVKHATCRPHDNWPCSGQVYLDSRKLRATFSTFSLSNGDVLQKDLWLALFSKQDDITNLVQWLHLNFMVPVMVNGMVGSRLPGISGMQNCFSSSTRDRSVSGSEVRIDICPEVLIWWPHIAHGSPTCHLNGWHVQKLKWFWTLVGMWLLVASC